MFTSPAAFMYFPAICLDFLTFFHRGFLFYSRDLDICIWVFLLGSPSYLQLSTLPLSGSRPQVSYQMQPALARGSHNSVMQIKKFIMFLFSILSEDVCHFMIAPTLIFNQYCHRFWNVTKFKLFSSLPKLGEPKQLY